MSMKNIIFQRDSMQCGIACLANVCHILGKEYSIEDLSSFCHVSNRGISFSGIKDAAEAIGLKAAGIISRMAHIPSGASSSI